MASPEVARLTRRVDAQDDTISDIVLDIKDTVDQHTEALVAIQQTQNTMQQDLTTVQQTQAQHSELLAEILRRLGGSTPG